MTERYNQLDSVGGQKLIQLKWCSSQAPKASLPTLDSPFLGNPLAFCPSEVGQQRHEVVLPSSQQSSSCRRHWAALLQENLINILHMRLLTALLVLSLQCLSGSGYPGLKSPCYKSPKGLPCFGSLGFESSESKSSGSMMTSGNLFY